MIKSYKYFVFCICILFFGCKKKSSLADFTSFSKDSVFFYLNKFNDVSLSNIERSRFAEKARKNTQYIQNDTLKVKYLDEISNSFLSLNDLDNYKSVNLELLNYYQNKKDSLNISKSYWKLGYYHQINYKQDSAYHYYFLANKNYLSLKNELYSGNMLLNIATIQESVKDYIGSEINTIKAISKLSDFDEYRSLYLAYNNLGVVYNKLGHYDLSIENNKKAIEFLKKINNNTFLKATSLNNIGMSYYRNGDIQKSIKYYNEALEIENLFNARPRIFAMLIDNLAYSKFKLNQLEELPNLFFKSLKIRDSLQIFDGLVESNLHLSEYFKSIKDLNKAVEYALNARNYAIKSKYNEGILDSYLLLSQIDVEEKRSDYLRDYIKLTDSLQQNERSILDKFTRIAYETDEITQEKEAESKKKWWTLFLSSIGASLSLLLFLNMKQHSKNKELHYNKKQEQANIQIYNLMLSQKSKFQEGSSKEKKRISEELHDGILGRLFGTRLGLDSLNEGNTKSEVKEREVYIKELQIIEEDIRKISHNLNTEIATSNSSFEQLLNQLISKQCKITNFEYNLIFNNLKNWENISNEIKIHIYRTLQESLQNINKYARASLVEVKVEKDEGNLLLNIIDNGVGFNIKKKVSGIGLKNIHSRAKALNGYMKINSKLGEGTHIVIKIPLQI